MSWLYIRGVKRLSLVVLAAGVLAGCGTATSPGNGSTIDDIDSWQSWGRVGQEWLNRCSDSEWGCIITQVDNLATAAKELPSRSDPGVVPPDRVLKTYQDDYQVYADNNCRERPSGKGDADRGVRCTLAELRLPQSSLAVHELVDKLAAGK